MNKTVCMLTAICLSLGATAALAQPGDHDEWKERVKREKTEFFNRELRMDAKQAAKFWPVYEKISKSQWAAQKELIENKESVEKALETGKADFKALLDSHIKACENFEKANSNAVKQFRQEFGDEFTLRVLVAEEKFRRAQIHRLNRGGKPGSPEADGGKRPDPCPKNAGRPGPGKRP